MDFYTSLYAQAKQPSISIAQDSADEEPKKAGPGRLFNKKELEERAKKLTQDGFFGLFNRSEAAKKGWETRKQNGGGAGQKQWTPGVWPKQNNATAAAPAKPAAQTTSPLSILPKHLTKGGKHGSEYDANKEMYAASQDESPIARLIAARKKAGLPLGKGTKKTDKKD